jgi:hypothetical protein
MKTPKSNTHTFKVLQWMKKGLSITSWQAIDEFGCTRLADVIYRLRNEYGLTIKDEMVSVVNRHGRTVKIARYELITES